MRWWCDNCHRVSWSFIDSVVVSLKYHLFWPFVRLEIPWWLSFVVLITKRIYLFRCHMVKVVSRQIQCGQIECRQMYFMDTQNYDLLLPLNHFSYIRPFSKWCNWANWQYDTIVWMLFVSISIWISIGQQNESIYLFVQYNRVIFFIFCL